MATACETTGDSNDESAPNALCLKVGPAALPLRSRWCLAELPSHSSTPSIRTSDKRRDGSHGMKHVTNIVGEVVWKTFHVSHSSPLKGFGSFVANRLGT